MKRHSINLTIYFSVIISFFLSNCKKQNNDIKKQKIITVERKETPKISKNEKILTRLIEMKNAFESGSKEDMLQFFNFPTKNYLFIKSNEMFRQNVEANNNKITKNCFLNYAEIKKEYDHPSLSKLLTTLDLNSLKKNNTIEKKLEIKDDECFYIYKIEIIKNTLIISYGTNSNQKYYEEGDCSERHTFLYFKIINNRIIFDKSDFAG